jgi:hypothetical protein
VSQLHDQHGVSSVLVGRTVTAVTRVNIIPVLLGFMKPSRGSGALMTPSLYEDGAVNDYVGTIWWPLGPLAMETTVCAGVVGVG